MQCVCMMIWCFCHYKLICVTRMAKEKPALSPVSQLPPTSAAVVDVAVSNMGDGKREKVCIFIV